MALPAIGAALSLLGRAALSGLGGAARIGSYSTLAGMRNAAIRSIGRSYRGRRRRGRRLRPLTGRSLMRRARRLSRGPVFSRRSRMRKLRIRGQMRRMARSQAILNALPASAPRGVRQRAQSAFQQAQTTLQNMVDTGGSQVNMAQGLAMMVSAASNATKGLIGLGVASYTASRGMELIGRQFAQYSGGHAAANAMLDVSRIRRTISIGSATSEGYQELIQSVNRLEESAKPFQTAAINVANSVLTKLNNLTAAYLEFLNRTMPDWLHKMLEAKPGMNGPAFTIDPMTAEMRNWLNTHLPNPPGAVNPRGPGLSPPNIPGRLP